jgi:hypothetical protein
VEGVSNLVSPPVRIGGRVSELVMPDGWNDARVNDTLRYHSEIAYRLTLQRTALESALIPITAYIVVACVEAWRRYPEMMVEIADAMPPEEIGARGRVVGNEIDTVRLWSIANFPLIGRNALAPVGLTDPATDPIRAAVVLDFWERAATAFRADGTRQAADADGRVVPYADVIDEIVAGCAPVDDARRADVSRLNALLTSYEFLLWFDTRSGYQDSGPYPLPDGRLVLLRHFVKVGPSDFPWSHEIAKEMPHSTVLLAFVLRDVAFGVSDFGTAVTQPEDYLPHVEAFGAFATSDGTLVPLNDDDCTTLAAEAKRAQRAQYRMIAGMERRDKINAGAYVYFSFLRPFAEIAGVELDWTVPRDSLDLYPMLELIDSAPEMPTLDDPGHYYLPLP